MREFTKEIYWYARGWSKNILARQGEVQNIYAGSIQKTGSQWIKTIFQDKRIQKYTGLLCYPQRRYEVGEFKKQFPTYTFVPGLYIPYYLYEEIVKPENYATFYIIRDPRNIIVSWYYSMIETHNLMGNVSMHRNRLKSMNFEDGIAYCIEAQQLKLSFVRSWVYSKDPKVKIVKFEDLTSNPHKEFKKIFEHCQINIPEHEFRIVMNDYTKQKMRERDLVAKKGKTESHYRHKSTDWEEVFTENHKHLFDQINGNLLEVLGYAP